MRAYNTRKIPKIKLLTVWTFKQWDNSPIQSEILWAVCGLGKDVITSKMKQPFHDAILPGSNQSKEFILPSNKVDEIQIVCALYMNDQAYPVVTEHNVLLFYIYLDRLNCTQHMVVHFEELTSVLPSQVSRFSLVEALRKLKRLDPSYGHDTVCHTGAVLTREVNLKLKQIEKRTGPLVQQLNSYLSCTSYSLGNMSNQPHELIMTPPIVFGLHVLICSNNQQDTSYFSIFITG
ncbi:unnamed protein product [Protopolystoma xenopodis]|uniref:Uncharacterized protein n=1 Tax=Protopolystoma xenopodis TaxID=117903 RepID=A0A448WCJ1_9PLAT|nr:unnamed protein product [Protopolystoma xenopodis]